MSSIPYQLQEQDEHLNRMRFALLPVTCHSLFFSFPMRGKSTLNNAKQLEISSTPQRKNGIVQSINPIFGKN